MSEQKLTRQQLLDDIIKSIAFWRDKPPTSESELDEIAKYRKMDTKRLEAKHDFWSKLVKEKSARLFAEFSEKRHLPDFVTPEMFDFLEDLRKSGETNMYGATPYIAEEFGLNKIQARKVLGYWMESKNETQNEETTTMAKKDETKKGKKDETKKGKKDEEKKKKAAPPPPPEPEDDDEDLDDEELEDQEESTDEADEADDAEESTDEADEADDAEESTDDDEDDDDELDGDEPDVSYRRALEVLFNTTLKKEDRPNLKKFTDTQCEMELKENVDMLAPEDKHTVLTQNKDGEAVWAFFVKLRGDLGKKKGKKDKKADKPAGEKAKKEPKPKKDPGAPPNWGEGTSSRHILDIIKAAGKKGITLADIQSKFAAMVKAGKASSNSPESRAKGIAADCIKFKFATKTDDGKYVAS